MAGRSTTGKAVAECLHGGAVTTMADHERCPCSERVVVGEGDEMGVRWCGELARIDDFTGRGAEQQSVCCRNEYPER